ncbi:Response regulator [Azospirillaceae bacterium]
MNDRFILLVEDNPSDIALTKRAVTKNMASQRMVVVEDGQEAVDFLFAAGKYQERDRFDLPSLVLLDMNLPKLDGVEVLRRVRSNPVTRRLPVVILSSSVEERDLSRSYDLGVNSYIRKAVDYTQFSEYMKCLSFYWLTINEAPPTNTSAI